MELEIVEVLGTSGVTRFRAQIRSWQYALPTPEGLIILCGMSPTLCTFGSAPGVLCFDETPSLEAERHVNWEAEKEEAHMVCDLLPFIKRGWLCVVVLGPTDFRCEK